MQLYTLCVCPSGLNAMQNLAALAAAATATQATATGSSAMTTSSSPLSALTSSGKLKKESVQFADCITVVDDLGIMPFSLVLVKLECMLSLVESAFVLKNFN